MIAFKLRINGGEPIVAGAPDLHVIYAQFHLLGKLGERTNYHREMQSVCYLGGTTLPSADHFEREKLDWLHGPPLKVGDVISLEIVEAELDDVSPVTSRKPYPDRPDASSSAPKSR